jgi:ribonuclease VapC
MLLGEDESPRYLAAINTTSRRLVSAASYLEAAIVMTRRSGSGAREELDQLLAELEVEIVSFNRAQADFAIAAHMQYGKGSGHPAQLNFGDCFTYALAKEQDEPILFKGNDFAQTDIARAVDP